MVAIHKSFSEHVQKARRMCRTAEEEAGENFTCFILRGRKIHDLNIFFFECALKIK